MLTDFLYNYVSNDESCLLGIIPDEDNFARLLSPLNANTLYPKLSSIETNYWIKKNSIINDENVKVLGKSFISNDTRYDWSISTGLNILGKTSSTGSNFTFSIKFKINTANIGNRTISLFKQGGTDVNDTLDIHFEFNRDIDISGASDKLVINVYYETPSDSVALNLQSFELTNISTLLDREVQLTVIIDSDNSVIKVLSNNELIGRKIMELDKILDLPLNTPQNTQGNMYMNTIIGGSKFMEMKNAYIWKRALSPVEVKFLNKINSERFEKTTEIPEDINSLTFTAIENSSIKMIVEGNPTVSGIEYRRSLISSWKPYTIGERIDLSRGTKVQFRNTLTSLSLNENNYVKFVMGGKIEASGNIQSMLNYSDSCTDYCFYNLFRECVTLIKAPELPATTLANYCYANMFYDCSALKRNPDLLALNLADYCYSHMFANCILLKSTTELPATTLAPWCYSNMFNNCKLLRVVPNLPSMELVIGCYDNMFNGCSILKYPPELSATTLAQSCYFRMFKGCSSLTEAPELPATTLADDCYQQMFDSCTSLSSAPELPATTLAQSCYYGMFGECTSLTNISNNLLSATTLASSCYGYMFKGCSSLTEAPELPATTLTNDCYYKMFKDCTSLTQAPELPATTLAERCYYEMFNGCTSLSSINVAFTDWGDASLSATMDWLNGVSQDGSFTKFSKLPATLGGSNIPSSWNILNIATPLSYLESNGNQYIDTGITNENATVEITCEGNRSCWMQIGL